MNIAKKLGLIVSAVVCWGIMDQPRRKPPVRVINNFFTVPTKGCSGSCGGNCKCGNH